MYSFYSFFGGMTVLVSFIGIFWRCPFFIAFFRNTKNTKARVLQSFYLEAHSKHRAEALHGKALRVCSRDTSANNCIPIEHQKRTDFGLSSFLFAGLFGALMELSRFEMSKMEAKLEVSVVELYYSAKYGFCEYKKETFAEKMRLRLE